MKRNSFLLIIFVFLFFSGKAQDVLGKWYSLDPDSGENESIIELYEKDNRVFGKIVSLLKEEDQGNTCVECTGKDKNQPLEGLIIVRGLIKDGDEWSDGKILDPHNGKLYKCTISLVEKDKLKLRGYIGFSLIGRDEYWHRVLE